MTKTTYVLRNGQLVDKASLKPKPLELLPVNLGDLSVLRALDGFIKSAVRGDWPN